MTAKEKAKELYFKMYNIYGYTDYHLIAKQCALILADEVLDNLEDNTGKDIKYWQEVKQEIEKL